MREARPKRQQSSKNYQYLLHSDENKQNKNPNGKDLGARGRQATPIRGNRTPVFNFSINFTPTINCHVFVRALHWRSFAFPSSSSIVFLFFTSSLPFTIHTLIIVWCLKSHLIDFCVGVIVIYFPGSRLPSFHLHFLNVHSSCEPLEPI